MSSFSNIVTHQLGKGPVMALDLNTISEQQKLRIIHAAFSVSYFLGNGDIAAEVQGSEADDALNGLTASLDALDRLFTPITPGADLHNQYVADTYPVIRAGILLNVHRDNLTDVEVRATVQRLRSEGNAFAQHAEALEASK